MPRDDWQESKPLQDDDLAQSNELEIREKQTRLQRRFANIRAGIDPEYNTSLVNLNENVPFVETFDPNTNQRVRIYKYPKETPIDLPTQKYGEYMEEEELATKIKVDPNYFPQELNPLEKLVGIKEPKEKFYSRSVNALDFGKFAFDPMTANDFNTAKYLQDQERTLATTIHSGILKDKELEEVKVRHKAINDVIAFGKVQAKRKFADQLLESNARFLAELGYIPIPEHLKENPGFWNYALATPRGFGQVIGNVLKGVADINDIIYRELTGKVQLDPLNVIYSTSLRYKGLKTQALWKLGNWITDVSTPDLLKRRMDFTEKTLMGIGSTLGFLLPSLLTGGGSIMSALIGGYANFSPEYEAALEKTKGDYKKAYQVAALNFAFGMTEALPLAKFFKGLSLVNKEGAFLKAIFEGAEEMTQEALLQQLPSNITAFHLYDSSRDLTEGVVEGGAIGFLSGFLMSSSFQLASNMLSKVQKTKEEMELLRAFEEHLRKSFIEAQKQANDVASDILDQITIVRPKTAEDIAFQRVKEPQETTPEDVITFLQEQRVLNRRKFKGELTVKKTEGLYYEGLEDANNLERIDRYNRTLGFPIIKVVPWGKTAKIEIDEEQLAAYNKSKKEGAPGWYPFQLADASYTPLSSEEHESVVQMTSWLRKNYPEIELGYINDPALDWRGKANLKAAHAIVNLALEKTDTVPHEYVHHYINWFRESDVVQRGIKLFGTEEQLVQALGELFTGRFEERSGSYVSQIKQWWGDFVNWLKSYMGKDDVLRTIVADFEKGSSKAASTGAITSNEEMLGYETVANALFRLHDHRTEEAGHTVQEKQEILRDAVSRTRIKDRAVLINDDARKILPSFADKAADVILTDAPYGVNFRYPGYKDTVENLEVLIKELLPEMRRVGKVVAINVGFANEHLYPVPDLKMILRDNQHDTPLNVFLYGEITPKIKSKLEELQEFLSKQPAVIDIQAEDVLDRAVTLPLGHRATMPIRTWVNLLHSLLGTDDVENKLVIDPFLGTGTTSLAAYKLGAESVGIEIDPETFTKADSLYEMTLRAKALGKMEREKVLSLAPKWAREVLLALELEGFEMAGSMSLAEYGDIYRQDAAPSDFDLRIAHEDIAENVGMNIMPTSPGILVWQDQRGRERQTETWHISNQAYDRLLHYLKSVIHPDLTIDWLPRYDFTLNQIQVHSRVKKEVAQTEKDLIFDIFITFGEATEFLNPAQRTFNAKLSYGRWKDWQDFWLFKYIPAYKDEFYQKVGSEKFMRFNGIISRKTVQRRNTVLFLFGDNFIRKGMLGQAKEMRGEPNAVGIITKKFPSNASTSFLTDEELEKNKIIIRTDFNKAIKEWKTGKYEKVVIPPLGVGLAQLPTKAPKTFKFLQEEIDRFEQIVVGEEKVAKVPGTTEGTLEEPVDSQPSIEESLAKEQEEVISDIIVLDDEEHTDKIEDHPNQSQLDKQSQKDVAKQDITIRLDASGIVNALRDDFEGVVPIELQNPADFWGWIQSFKTGNMTADYDAFLEAWQQKFGDLWTKEVLKHPSNRSFLQEVFISQYYAVRTNGVSISIDPEYNVLEVEDLEGDAYIDAEGKPKSLIETEQLWQRAARSLSANLPIGVVVKEIKTVAQVRENLDVKIIENSLLDFDLIARKEGTEEEILPTKLITSNQVEHQKRNLMKFRRGLMKKGFVWLGFVHGSRTSLVVDINSILSNDASFKDLILEATDYMLKREQAEPGSTMIDVAALQKGNFTEAQVHDILFSYIYEANTLDKLLGGQLSALEKIKRSKGFVGEAPTGFVTRGVRNTLRNLTRASSIYLTTSTAGIDKIMYKYVVVDPATFPDAYRKKFNSEAGDGAEIVSDFFSEVWNEANGVPFDRRGTIKPKFFDVGTFWKWARSTVMPDSPFAAFMEKNGVAGVVFKSAIKIGQDENLVSYDDILTGKKVGADFIYEHDILQDSSIMAKGKIAREAGGLGAAVNVTGIASMLSEKEREWLYEWLDEDFTDFKEYLDQLVADPQRLSTAITDFIANSGYESDVTKFAMLSFGRDHLVKYPVVMDYALKGFFKKKLLEAARHFKTGSIPVLIPDLGPLNNLKETLKDALPSTFDEDGYIEKDHVLIDYFMAKRLNLKVGDKVFCLVTPPGSFADMRTMVVGGILPKAVGKNVVMGNIKQFQDNSGKDYDIDWLSLIPAKTARAESVWNAVKKLNVDKQYQEMMENYVDRDKARRILDLLGLPYTEANLKDWEKIAPMVKLDGKDTGWFALNENFGKLSLAKTRDYVDLQHVTYQGLIGQLYVWKQLYNLFLETEFEFRGIRANKDIATTLPVLKVLTDMALDWTKSYDIGKIKFTWEDLIAGLFTFENTEDRNTVIEKWATALEPIRQALGVLSLHNRAMGKHDYVSYHKLLARARATLKKFPELRDSVISRTLKQATLIGLPKLALTVRQVDEVTKHVREQFLGAEEDDWELVIGEYIDELGSKRVRVLETFKALSFLGVRASGADEIKNIKILQSYTRSALKKGEDFRDFPVDDVWDQWLNVVMQNVVFKPNTNNQSFIFGATGKGGVPANGYRYLIGNRKGKPLFSISQVIDGKPIKRQNFRSWDRFLKNVDDSFWEEILKDSFLGLFEKLVKTSQNSVVKKVSDELLKTMYKASVKSEKLRSAPDRIRKLFYLASLGYLNISNRYDLGTAVQGMYVGVQSKTGQQFDKHRIVSLSKPIVMLNDYAWTDPVAKDLVQRWLDLTNDAIERVTSKEVAVESPGKSLNSFIIPIPMLALGNRAALSEEQLRQKLADNLGLKFETNEERDMYIDAMIQENLAPDPSLTDREQTLQAERNMKYFLHTIDRAISESKKRYKAGWRVMSTLGFLFGLGKRSIGFDNFIRVHSKRNKIYRSEDVVFSLPFQGHTVDLTAWNIATTFKEWNPYGAAVNLSGAQIYWYIQDQLMKRHEHKRVFLEDLTNSVIQYMGHRFENNIVTAVHMTGTAQHQEAFEAAEGKDRNELLKDVIIAQSIAYYGDSELELHNASPDEYFRFAQQVTKEFDDSTNYRNTRILVGALRYRYVLDYIVPAQIEMQKSNLIKWKEKGVESGSLSVETAAKAFIRELDKMTAQIKHVPSYMPHMFSNKEAWIKAKMKQIDPAGLDPKNARRLAKKERERRDSEKTHIGGDGSVFDIFFLPRDKGLEGYIKSPTVVERYMQQLNALFRYQNSFMAQEAAEYLLKDETSFMYKYAKHMAAVGRGANKYGVSKDINKTKKNDVVLFQVVQDVDEAIEPENIFGVVQRKTSKILEVLTADGKTRKFSRYDIINMRVMRGTNLLSRVNLWAVSLGLKGDVKNNTLPLLLRTILQMEAGAMLTGTQFSLRNKFGGEIQNFMLYGKDLMLKVTNDINSIGIKAISDRKFLSERENKRYQIVYENSIALLGNIHEFMGKFGGMLNVLKLSEEVSSDEVEWLQRTIGEYNTLKEGLFKNDPSEIGFDKWRTNVMRLRRLWEWTVPKLNLNLFAKGSRTFNPAAVEHGLRLRVAFATVEFYNTLDPNNPAEAKLLATLVDQALRNTQLLYRVGLDQSILASSPLARAFLVNYLHYPISMLWNQAYYMNNMARQIRYFGIKKALVGSLIDVNETTESKKRLGKEKIAYTITIGKGTESERTFSFEDKRYARVAFRLFTIGFLMELLKKPTRFLLRTMRYTMGLTGDQGVLYMIAMLSDIGVNSFDQPLFAYIAQATAFLASNLIGDDDKDWSAQDKWVKKVKKMLYLTQEEYLRETLTNPKTREVMRAVQHDMVKNQYVMDLIDDLLRPLPLGVHQSILAQGLVQLFVTGSFYPDDYTNIGLNLLNTFFPLRQTRNPMLGTWNSKIGYPLGVGYTPLHTWKIQRQRQMERNLKGE